MRGTMGPRFRGDDRLRDARFVCRLTPPWLRLALDARAGEVGAGRGGDARAELIAQGPRLDLLDRAGRDLAELERAERNPDQAVHREAEVTEHVAHLAVLALADREGEPDIAALRAVDRGLDRSVADAVDGDARAQPVELGLGHAAVRAHAIAPQPAGGGELERAREPAVIGQQQSPSVLRSRRPTLTRRGRLLGSSAKMVGRPPGSTCVVKRPRGL